MKKILSILCVIILSVWIFVGCKSNDKSVNEISKLESELFSIKQELMYSSVKIEELNNELIDANEKNKELENFIINPSKIFVGSIDLDMETEGFLYGTWKVEKLLGFCNSYNDASEYPTGQKIIGDEIIIKKNLFSSKGLKNYTNYQYELTKPLYKIKNICYDSTSFYSFFKTDVLDLNENDIVKVIVVSSGTGPFVSAGSFLVINNDRLIFCLEATFFELKKLNNKE